MYSLAKPNSNKIDGLRQQEQEEERKQEVGERRTITGTKNRQPYQPRLGFDDGEVPATNPIVGAIQVRNRLASSSSSSSFSLSMQTDDNHNAAQPRATTNDNDTPDTLVTSARLVDEDQEKIIRRLEEQIQQVLQNQQRQQQDPTTTLVDVAIATEISPPSRPQLTLQHKLCRGGAALCLFLLGAIALVVVFIANRGNKGSTEAPFTGTPSPWPTSPSTSPPTPVPVTILAPVSDYIHETQLHTGVDAEPTDYYYSDPNRNNLIDGVVDDYGYGMISAWEPHGENNGEDGRVAFYFDRSVIISGISLFFMSVPCYGLDTPEQVEVDVGDATYTLLTNYTESEEMLPFTHWMDFRSQEDKFSRASVSTVTLRVFCGNMEAFRCNHNFINLKCGISEVEFFQLLTS